LVFGFGNFASAASRSRKDQQEDGSSGRLLNRRGTLLGNLALVECTSGIAAHMVRVSSRGSRFGRRAATSGAGLCRKSYGAGMGRRSHGPLLLP
jgi:hypothetical protein